MLPATFTKSSLESSSDRIGLCGIERGFVIELLPLYLNIKGGSLKANLLTRFHFRQFGKSYMYTISGIFSFFSFVKSSGGNNVEEN